MKSAKKSGLLVKALCVTAFAVGISVCASAQTSNSGTSVTVASHHPDSVATVGGNGNTYYVPRSKAYQQIQNPIGKESGSNSGNTSAQPAATTTNAAPKKD